MNTTKSPPVQEVNPINQFVEGYYSDSSRSLAKDLVSFLGSIGEQREVREFAEDLEFHLREEQRKVEMNDSRYSALRKYNMDELCREVARSYKLGECNVELVRQYGKLLLTLIEQHDERVISALERIRQADASAPFNAESFFKKILTNKPVRQEDAGQTAYYLGKLQFE